MEKLALFCSGSGTNAQAIIDYFKGREDVRVVCLLANTPKAYALQRARAENITSCVFTKDSFNNTTAVDDFLLAQGATCLILAGFLWLVPERILQQYPQRVLNIHPALLPDFGGEGMYGKHVHEAVAAEGRTESGITVHLADAAYDRGRILFQARTALLPNATPDDIERAVRELELKHYPSAIDAHLKALAER